MEVGDDDVVALQEARRRQDEVGEIGRIGREQVEHDCEQVLAGERTQQPRLLGVGGGDVDVPAQQRPGAVVILQARGEVHVADRLGDVDGQLRGGEVVLVDPPVSAAVEIQQTGAGLAQIARRGRQDRDGANRVATARLALEALPDPEQRRTRRIQPGRLLDQLGGHAGDALTPARRALRSSAGSSSSKPIGAPRDQLAIAQSLAADPCRAARTRAPRRCPGTAAGADRPRGRSGSAPGRRRSPAPGASGSHCSCWWGAEADGLAPHTRMHFASRAVRGSKPSSDVP